MKFPLKMVPSQGTCSFTGGNMKSFIIETSIGKSMVDQPSKESESPEIGTHTIHVWYIYLHLVVW